jgi:asparagine N-glycosylation enzyme membrane subunit Stt3
MNGKERFYLLFSVIVAVLAAHATIRITDSLLTDTYGSVAGILAMAVFFGGLALMLKGVDAIQRERWDRERKDRIS